MEAIISAENVTFSYPADEEAEARLTLDGVTLDIEQGTFTAILGRNGCGKTTLLNAIGGLDKINQGDIYINGQRISRRLSGKVDQIRTLNVGYIFQNYNLVDSMTVYDNVAYAMRVIGAREREIRERVPYVLELVGLDTKSRRHPGELSGGEQQRLAIARALVNNPSTIIADEPTTLTIRAIITI